MKVKWLSIEDKWHFRSDDTLFLFMQFFLHIPEIFQGILVRLVVWMFKITFLFMFNMFHLDTISSLWKLCQIEICEFLNCFFLFLDTNFLSIVLAITEHMTGWFNSRRDVTQTGYIAVGVRGERDVVDWRVL